ncbi:MAG: FAD-dependent oxidoreductase [Ignavibacteriales bacterium]|nr:FAD-dependent oxidoreductase [Ignavibacteriales bacterium]
MVKEIEIVVKPEDSRNNEKIKALILKEVREDRTKITGYYISKRSIDARSKFPIYRFKALVFIDEDVVTPVSPPEYKEALQKKRVIIIGAGPAGIFAALRLLESGIKPIIFERGKDVRSRRKDLRAIMQFHQINPDSNYCFGEGGAGTYSDGKLYTRSDKRGNVLKILNILVMHGADPDIIVDAHPHIGSNKLPGIVTAMRETILNYGGEIHFDSRVTGIIRDGDIIKGVKVNGVEEHFGDAVILATGHSARDIYYLLHDENILIEAKPFALGVRIEHPQSLIDESRYHSKIRSEFLPAASYSLTCQVAGRGVYSFCMCPGGIIVPASSAPGELVLNGMSVSRRDSPFANSGFVVEVTPQDWNQFTKSGALAALEYQKMVELSAWEAGGKTQTAPAQRVNDFLKGKISSSLPKSSYIPGTVSTDLHEVLPVEISRRLKESLKVFDSKLKGYISADAQMLAVESRTSSPVRIPRDRTTLMHPQIKGLYPCGEGAGYAGGIVSAAIDGENVASAILNVSSNR